LTADGEAFVRNLLLAARSAETIPGPFDVAEGARPEPDPVADAPVLRPADAE
jgi:hypothetical protein